MWIAVAQNLQTIIMQQIQDLQKGKGGNGVGDQNKRPPGGFQKGPMQHSPYGPPQGGGGNPNLVKNAQQTALTLLLASQMQQQSGGGGMGNNGGGSGQISPNSPNNGMNAATNLQNQQLLAALQAMSKGANGSCNNDQYLSGMLNSGGSNVSNLLGLGSPVQQQLDQSANGIPQGFFSSHGDGMLSPGSVGSNGTNNSGSAKDDHHWAAFKSGNRSSSSSYGTNGMHKVSENNPCTTIIITQMLL